MFSKTFYVTLLCFLAYSEATCPANSVKETGVSSTEITEIVNKHNYYRLQMANGLIPGQPKASNMKRMSWDAKLAVEAQKIANTCVFEHVAVHDDRFEVGQNLYTWMSSGVLLKANWTSGVKAWFDEVYDGYVFGGDEYNHYTQVVWADTTLVGCGYTHFKNRDGWYQKLYVCNYGPAGNWQGETPYQVGKGCENLC